MMENVGARLSAPNEKMGALKRAPTYVIIGNGIAGVTAAELLRAEDSAATITVIADDPFPVYYRPALKDYLAGRVREDKLWARPTSFYQDRNIRFLPERVVGIQAGQHTVRLQSGSEVGYSRLLLATGARASRLRCPGLNLVGVATLRTVADYQAVLNRLNVVRRAVVSGSGTLALETIETLRHRGYQVTHLLRRRTLWSEVLDATASDLVLQQERRNGVDVRLEEEIAEITGGQGQVKGIITSSGAHISCEMVLIAIGVEPIVDFIKSSGIGCGRGVKVDGKMRTNAPDIYAAGDVLETTDTTTGRTRVIGQWYPAIQQARAAAYSLLDLLDSSSPFRSSTFYNATFLYGLDFACVGLTNVQGYQEIVADPRPRTYRKVLLKDGVPVGMLSLGDRKQGLAFKRAIDHHVNLLPVISRLFADDFKLHDWLDSQGVPPPLPGVKREGDAAVKQVAYAGGKTSAGVMVLKPQPLSEALLVPLATNKEVRLPETHLSQTRVVTIGRQTGVDLLIDHSSISRRHAEISYANGHYLLSDLGSANGTFVNDVHVEPRSVRVLQQNDQVRFGSMARFTFLTRASSEQKKQAAAGSASMAGITMLDEMATAIYATSISHVGAVLGQPVLNPDGSLLLPGATSPVPATVVTTFKEVPVLILVASSLSLEEGNRPPAVFPLQRGKHIMLGRDKGNEIVLTDIVASRRHAEVFPGPDGFYIRNLGSSNGVIVNQTRIDNPYLLSHGDRITVGSSTIYFIDLQSGRDREKQDTGGESFHGQLIVCRQCGVMNTRVARFCASCGAPVGVR